MAIVVGLISNEWRPRIQAVLYHRGFPQRHGLPTGETRAWLERLAFPRQHWASGR